MALIRVVKVSRPKVVNVLEERGNIELKLENGTELGWSMKAAKFAGAMQVISFAKQHGFSLFFDPDDEDLEADGEIDV